MGKIVNISKIKTGLYNNYLTCSTYNIYQSGGLL